MSIDLIVSINAILPVSEFVADKYVFFATTNGTVKKTSLTDFSRPMKRGIIAINLDDDDHLIGVALTDGKHDVMLFSNAGNSEIGSMKLLQKLIR